MLSSEFSGGKQKGHTIRGMGLITESVRERGREGRIGREKHPERKKERVRERGGRGREISERERERERERE